MALVCLPVALTFMPIFVGIGQVIQKFEGGGAQTVWGFFSFRKETASSMEHSSC
jgi:hypothetical protein